MNDSLIWEKVLEGEDVQAKTEFGEYVISVDSVFAGSTCYLWFPGNEDEHNREFLEIKTAKLAAQADYNRRTAKE